MVEFILFDIIFIVIFGKVCEGDIWICVQFFDVVVVFGM